MSTPVNPIRRSVQNLTRDVAVNVVANLFAGGIGTALVAAFGKIRWLWSVAFWLVAGAVVLVLLTTAMRSDER
ncbi:MAG TPA: hypothetical protein VK028_15155 [Micromonosporaceae bacterium]|nr:hypothetical protein [Micromonosporaceae bacterium]